MTIRHMKIFMSLCDNGCNMTRTAEALHMSQPAVSLAVRELEAYYGVVLFDRIGRHLRITDVGQRFLEYAARISSLFDNMETELRNWDSFGILRVGASVTIGSQFLPGYVREFSRRRPGTEVQVQVAPSGELEKKLLAGELDLALIEGVPHAPAILSEEYMRDTLSVICPAGGAFRQGQTISVRQFRQQKFLLREQGSGTREVFDRVTQSAGFTVTPIWEAVSTAALVNAVINGLGIAVLPLRMITEPLRRGLVVTVQVEGLDFSRRFYILHRRDKYLTACAKEFIALCRESGAAPEQPAAPDTPDAPV